MPRHLSTLWLILLLAAGESACHKKQAVIQVPAPTPATTAEPDKPAAVPETEPTAPATQPPVTNPTPAKPAPATQTPETYQKNRTAAPPTPQPSSKRQPQPRNPTPAAAAPPPAPATPPAAPPASEPPKLGDMLTPDQQKELNTYIDQSLQQALGSLNTIRNRQLNKEQQDRVAQVRTFIQQAQTLRASDLPGAKSLAERAEVLARDLAASLQ